MNARWRSLAGAALHPSSACLQGDNSDYNAMMRFSTRLCVAVLASAWMGASAWAALPATLPDASGGRPWEMIAVEFPPVGGDVDVSVQDARGGPEFLRRVAGNAGRTWLPLPLVAPSDLAASGDGAWPLVITVRSSDRVVEQALPRLALGRGTNAGSGPRLVSNAPVPGFSGVCIIVSDQEIFAAPPLVFAGCDLIFLGPDLQNRITRERVLELLAVGVRLAVSADGAAGPPGATGLGRFLWEPTDLGGGHTIWTTAAQPVPPPAVIEPGLSRLPAGARSRELPPGITTALLLTAPLAILLLVLQRGLFHRRRVVLAASAISLAVLTGGMILYLQAHALRQQRLAQWCQAAASQDQSVGGIILEERLERCTAWFKASADIPAEVPRLLFPVAATVDQYWALRGVQVRFDGATHLHGTLPARGTLCWECRTASSLGALPAYPQTAAERSRLWEALQVSPADAWWLIGGYVKAAATPDEPGTLFATWAADKPWATGGHPEAASQGMPWYEMRFAPGHRYLLWRREETLHVVDYGSADRAPTAPRPVP